jgi:hypothetical protein
VQTRNCHEPGALLVGGSLSFRDHGLTCCALAVPPDVSAYSKEVAGPMNILQGSCGNGLAETATRPGAGAAIPGYSPGDSAV